MSTYGQIALPLSLLGVFVILLTAEWKFPLRKRKDAFKSRFLVNVLISVLALLTGALLVRTTAFNLTGWVEGKRYGLIGLLGLGPAASFAVGFLLMDLTFYYWHRATHKFAFLWRFHQVHHIDLDMDVTTSFRFHPGEVALSVPFRCAQAVLLGVGPATWVIYVGCFQAATMFHHSNLRLPIRLERIVNKVIVTPRMHGIHHSTRRKEVNSNYSTIFRWWDQLNRSLLLNVPQNSINIGVVGYLDRTSNRSSRLLTMPFQKTPLPKKTKKTDQNKTQPEQTPKYRNILMQ
ncbi:Fatty acid hydroxylase superfamily protein [Anaerohalosphaera lusitana]|uniref:Fatty acid hydroxylase superfamily protein n=1 Tax=Anaerohalosphaera lusitana TaxID=1936003 RepID=A0A1U9NQL3_9BACT|nr:sterol desaturase family protein [Anaerohalosphaera lusitana]AQT70199.1 Fatty acid hydroxylase superfamily protein [Anaerohalosphaera lusitana]